MTDDRGFISVIRGVLLNEDELPANNVGSGHIAGTPPDSPPGMTHRKRKRIAKMKDPKLFKALAAEGHVEFDLLSDARQRRFNEGKDGPVDIAPEISTDNPNDADPNLRKKSKKLPSKRSLRRGPDASIAINPILPTRFEDVVDESNPRRGLTLAQADFWIRQGLFGPKAKDVINYWRQAIVDPEKAMHNATYRPYVARALRDLLDLCIDDTMLNNRIRTILMKYKFRGDEDEIPEDLDEKELARFARWKEQSDFAEAYDSTPIAVLQHQMASCADPGRRARLAQEIRRRTGKAAVHRAQFRVGGNR